MSATVLAAIYRYALKSCRGQSLDATPVGPAGLPFDRHWMVADPGGRMLTGRQHPRLVLVTAEPADDGVTLGAPGVPALFVPNRSMTEPARASVWDDEFAAWRGSDAADAWLSGYLGAPARLLWVGADPQRRVATAPAVPLAFADGYPLLLIGEGSLAALNARLGRELAMRRFRPNLVVSGAAPFAEDGWREIRIGRAHLHLAKPCTRCVFTTVDPDTGIPSADREPLRTLRAFRAAPDGVLFGQNAIAGNAADIRVGEAVEVLA